MAKKGKPKGALRFELPFEAEPPALTSDAVGLPRLMRRPAGSYTMDVTVLDAADGRLLRAGVVVAHRVVAGAGEWYLAAPAWAPHLPAEQVEPMAGKGELPEPFARLIKPLVRGAALEPMATLSCERGEWLLRSKDGAAAGLVRDDKVQVHRADGSASQYREITVEPTDALTGQRREYLLSAARAAGATALTDFPTLQQRLGAPAMGLTSFPKPRPLERNASLEEFVTAIFAEHLGAIVRADLDRRAADSDSVVVLNERLWAFGRDLRGLAPVLEPAWREGLEDTLAGLPFETPADVEQPTLAVLDALVAAVRAPRLGDLSQRNAALLLFERAQQATMILADRCRSLTGESTHEAWQAALRAAQQLEVAATVLAPLMPKSMGKLLVNLDEVLTDLRACSTDALGGEPELDGVSPSQAYQLGLEHERRRGELGRRRRLFVALWPERVEKARRLMAKAKKKQQKQQKKK
ncbi:MAG: hypothetical protein Q4G35_07065 [Propionibacteriaceae bacterium]|nr:hypothetical protein [Propionibacteriaceae bacterium]